MVPRTTCSVLPDADLDLAADQAVNAGYGSAGSAAWRSQPCWRSVTIGDELVAKIKRADRRAADR